MRSLPFFKSEEMRVLMLIKPFLSLLISLQLSSARHVSFEGNSRPAIPKNLTITSIFEFNQTMLMTWDTLHSNTPVLMFVVRIKRNNRLVSDLTSFILSNASEGAIPCFFAFHSLTEHDQNFYQFAVQAVNTYGKSSFSYYTRPKTFQDYISTSPSIPSTEIPQDKINLGQDPPNVSANSFANGYGSDFHCDGICHFITVTYSIGLAFIIMIILIIPVKKNEYSNLAKQSALRYNTDGTHSHGAPPPPSHGAPQRAEEIPEPLKVQARPPISANSKEEEEEEEKPDASLLSEYFHGTQTEPLLVDGLNKPTEVSSDVSLDTEERSSSQINPNDVSDVPMAIAERRKSLMYTHDSYENQSDEEIKEQEYITFLRGLLKGYTVLKQNKSGGKPSKRKLFISQDLSCIKWVKPSVIKSPRASFTARGKSQIFVKDIVNVFTGLESNVFQKYGKAHKASLYMSIITTNGSLDIEADSEGMHQKLYNGFMMLFKEFNEERDVSRG